MDLVALDLEGSGAQDRENEAILEIALVPIVNWQPDMTLAYCTLINPGRPIAQRPWISPGLTNGVLQAAPPLAAVEPELARRINGKYLVGHNIGVDWRLLHLRCPAVAPAGLIDTLRLTRKLNADVKNGLVQVVERLNLTSEVNQLAVGSTPHRALWDTVAVGLLLSALSRLLYRREVVVGELFAAAGISVADSTGTLSQPSLFE
jgi:DNA polymerase-3 subunit epsilon/exodeoxyribonuclease X